VPFQHPSPRILKLMKRPASAEDTLARIRRWREIYPDITLRSTFIVGFPGETDAEFEELLAFLEEAQLDRVGCFAYSAVDGAAANALPRAVPEVVKHERRARLMLLQETISARRRQCRVGSTLSVLVDEVGPEGANARSSADAPEIDGIVRVAPDRRLKAGEFTTIRVTRADTHDLWAEVA
jgi:ribosomal protein S12 methylthiotransferase